MRTEIKPLVENNDIHLFLRRISRLRVDGLDGSIGAAQDATQPATAFLPLLPVELWRVVSILALFSTMNSLSTGAETAVTAAYELLRSCVFAAPPRSGRVPYGALPRSAVVEVAALSWADRFRLVSKLWSDLPVELRGMIPQKLISLAHDANALQRIVAGADGARVLLPAGDDARRMLQAVACLGGFTFTVRSHKESKGTMEFYLRCLHHRSASPSGGLGGSAGSAGSLSASVAVARDLSKTFQQSSTHGRHVSNAFGCPAVWRLLAVPGADFVLLITVGVHNHSTSGVEASRSFPFPPETQRFIIEGRKLIGGAFTFVTGSVRL